MNKLERLFAPLALALMSLVLVLGGISLGARASHAAALQQTTVHAQLNGPVERVSGAVQASVVPSISNIVGATYDEARGEVVIFGVADPDLPGLDYAYIRENLAIALRAYYDSAGPDVPGVSIEGTEDPLDVVYFGGVTDTHFGQVSFESDRLLKIYNLGVDNLTGITVTSNVTGYMSYPDRMQSLTETVADPILVRYFFTPTLLIEQITTPHTIIFSQTETFIDWAYLSVATSTATTEAAQGFVDNFNQYYLDYAAERWATYGDTTLYEMAQLSKLTAIAQWAHGQGLELKLPGMNDPWLSHYPISYAPTVTQTPGITVTWVQTISGDPYELSLRSGVYAVGMIRWILDTLEAHLMAQDVHAAIEECPAPMSCIVRPVQIRPFGAPFVETEGPLVAYVTSLADDALVNGDFEAGPGSAPWSQDSFFEMITPDSPHNGDHAALFPVYHNAQVALSQAFYIPGDATLARLTYWRAAATAETTHPHDFFASFLADADGARLATFEELDDGDADGYWRQVSFDVISYTGQAVQLWFTATTDGSDITNFVVDDISLDYLDLTPPTITTVVAPDVVALADAVEFHIAFHERMNTAVMPVVTVNLQESQMSYTLTAKTGVGYTNGFLDSDPSHWYGMYTFTSQVEEGAFGLDVSVGQDLAGNVMSTAKDVHTFTFDATLPQVQTVFPAGEASEVPVDASIVIAFSEPISTGTFNYLVSPDPGGWAVNWNDSTDVVTLTHGTFATGTLYAVTVTEAEDLAGNPLSDTPVAWSFTTVAPDTVAPEIRGTSPANGASGVAVDANVVLTFSEPISISTFSYLVSPDPGDWTASWNDANNVVTLTHNAFSVGTLHTVTVTEAEDLAGNPLDDAPVTWSFTTAAAPDTIAPEIQSTSPANEASGVAADTNVVITFSEPISIGTFSYFVSPDPGGWAAGWNDANDVVALTHNAFAPGTSYTITVTEAEDLAGNPLSDAPVTWSFTTLYKVYLPVTLKHSG
jgi:methionine-rich copper-binding protein CopC